MANDVTDKAATATRKIIYIAGWGRCGSTLLGNILGEIAGVFHAGELVYFGKRGIRDKRLCGCGTPIPACDVWSAVIRNLRQQPTRVDESELLELAKGQNTLNIKHQMLIYLPWLRKFQGRSLQKKIATIEALYSAVFDETGCSVIVDSSKIPAYGYLLSLSDKFEVYLVHMVRDSRAVVYSWSKDKQASNNKQPGIKKQGLFESILKYIVGNSAAAGLGRLPNVKSTVLRYEDLVEEPQSAIESLLTLADIEYDAGDVFHGKKIRLGMNHTSSGNPDRFNGGEIELQLDDRWKNKLSLVRKYLVTATTFLLLKKYAYL